MMSRNFVVLFFYIVIQIVFILSTFVMNMIKKTIDDESHWYGVKFEKALPMLVEKLNK